MKSTNFNKLIFIIKILIFYLLFFKSICLNSETLNFQNNLKTNQKKFYNVEFIFGKENNKNNFLLSGLKINLKPGWKIYWKNPGDAGLPPELNWEKVDNINNVDFLFPKPKRFNFFGIDTFGYEGEIVFPLKIYRNNSQEIIKGYLEFNAQICKKICIPIKDTIFINSDLINNQFINNTKKIMNY